MIKGFIRRKVRPQRSCKFAGAPVLISEALVARLDVFHRPDGVAIVRERSGLLPVVPTFAQEDASR